MYHSLWCQGCIWMRFGRLRMRLRRPIQRLLAIGTIVACAVGTILVLYTPNPPKMLVRGETLGVFGYSDGRICHQTPAVRYIATHSVVVCSTLWLTVTAHPICT